MYLVIKSLHAILLIYINLLTYKEIYAKQKAFNKLQQCQNDNIEKSENINSKTVQENSVISPQIEINNKMDYDEVEDFSKPNQCKCLDDIREIPNKNGENIAFNQTSCSLKSFNKGSGQKVVAFTIYGMDMNQRT